MWPLMVADIVRMHTNTYGCDWKCKNMAVVVICTKSGNTLGVLVHFVRCICSIITALHSVAILPLAVTEGADGKPKETDANGRPEGTHADVDRAIQEKSGVVLISYSMHQKRFPLHLHSMVPPSTVFLCSSMYASITTVTALWCCHHARQLMCLDIVTSGVSDNWDNFCRVSKSFHHWTTLYYPACKSILWVTWRLRVHLSNNRMECNYSVDRNMRQCMKNNTALAWKIFSKHCFWYRSVVLLKPVFSATKLR